jgi:tetratricopeptide (TPR) repeat protein
VKKEKDSRRLKQSEVGSSRKPARIRAMRLLLILLPVCAVLVALLAARCFSPQGTPPPQPPAVSRNPPKASPRAKKTAANADAAFSTRALAQALEEDAFAVIERLMTDFPRSPAPVALMGTIHAKLGNVEEAVRWWNRCLEMQPRHATAYYEIAGISLNKGEYEEALDLLRKALKINPRMPGIHHRMALAWMGLGNMREALAPLENEIKIAPRQKHVHGLLGEIYLQLGEFAKARKHFETAIRIPPDNPQTYYGLATTLTRLGQKEKAEEYMEKFRVLKARNRAAAAALKRNRDDVASMRQLVLLTYKDAGSVYHRQGQVNEALNCWQKAADLYPKETGCRVMMASVYAQNRRYPESLRMYEQLVAIDPWNPVYHMRVGALNAQMNRIADALAAVQRAIDLEPDDVTYRKLYQEIRSMK